MTNERMRRAIDSKLRGRCFLLIGLSVALIWFSVVWAGDQPHWGQHYSRNMVSDEVGLPSVFDPASGQNIRWIIPLGTHSYSTPMVASGKVLIGTNNEEPRDPKHVGDRGVLMCFEEKTGRLIWQFVVPKLSHDKFLDWTKAGMSSTATVEGDRVYIVTNRDEVACLDLNGLANGNDGPFKEEVVYMTPEGEPTLELGPLDADVIWVSDLRSLLGVRPHDSAQSSILIDGPYLYLNTSNGIDSKHEAVDKPEGPSLVVLDKATGQVIAKDGEKMGEKIFHCTWASPSLGVVNGRRLVFFGGSDGVVYAFEALDPNQAEAMRVSAAKAQAESWVPGKTPEQIAKLRTVWRFDFDPTAPKENVQSYIRNREESPSVLMGMPVFHNGRLYVTGGGDIWWGKRKAWIKCIDASLTGDITEKGLIWSYDLERHSCTTPSVHNGLVYVGDSGGKVHCLDEQTGKPYWVHNAQRELWASTLVADGKVFVGTRRGEFWVLKAGKELEVLHSLMLDSPSLGSPVAADGVLYIPTETQLYAIEKTSE